MALMAAARPCPEAMPAYEEIRVETVSDYQAFLELEARRNRAAERLVALQADYSAAAGKRAEELRADLESALQQFAEAMERLVALAESLGARSLSR